MSKRIVMSVLGSLVTSLVVWLGTLGMTNSDSNNVSLVVTHPIGCMLVSPKTVADGLTSAGDIVSVPPGRTLFKFDCGQGEVGVVKNVKAGQMTINIDPTGNSNTLNSDPSTGL
jgi:hypothetical protein